MEESHPDACADSQKKPENRQILLVDDEPLVCWSLENAFRKLGFFATTVGTGEAAVQELSTHPYAVVITDLRLPGIDGFVVAREAKQRSPTTPVMIVSAFGDTEARAEAAAIPGCYFVDKPFDISEMTRFVMRILSQCKNMHGREGN